MINLFKAQKRDRCPGLLLLTMLLPACSTGSHNTASHEPPGKPESTTKIQKRSKPRIGLTRENDRVLLYSEIDSNQHTSTRVELVFSYRPDITNKLARFTAKQWFEQQHQLLRLYDKQISLVQHQIVPGEKVRLKKFNRKQRDADAIIIFSSYLSPGDHRVIIKPRDLDYIYFMKESFIAQ